MYLANSIKDKGIGGRPAGAGTRTFENAVDHPETKWQVVNRLEVHVDGEPFRRRGEEAVLELGNVELPQRVGELGAQQGGLERGQVDH